MIHTLITEADKLEKLSIYLFGMGMLCLMLGFVFVAASFYESVMAPILIGIISIACFVAGTITNSSAVEQKMEAYYKCIDAGYEVFIDGQGINPENINIKSYNITFEEDSKKIFLTK